jgi:hypothetical protein
LGALLDWSLFASANCNDLCDYDPLRCPLWPKFLQTRQEGC